MKAPVSRALMTLAVRCFGERWRHWALAMQVEFEMAVADGKAFAFAAGCLGVALRQLPFQPEGRLQLARYAVALGVLIPIAVIQISLVFGFPSWFMGANWSDGVVLAGATQDQHFISVQHRTALILSIIWLSLGLAHLRLAWTVITSDWTGAIKTSAMLGAITITLFICMGALFLDLTFIVLHAASLAAELAGLAVLVSSHAPVQTNAGEDFTLG